MLGHFSAGFTLDTYAHVTTAAQKEAAQTMESILAVLYMGIFGTAVTHSLWNYSLRVMDASFCSMFYPMQPLVSSILGVLFLHEAITPGFVLGALMICCGIVAAVVSAKPKANR